MTGQEWMEIIVMLLCFVLAALASGTETALTSVGRLRVRYLAEQGSQAAAILQKLRADPNRYLSTVLFTNTLALIVASTSTTLLTDSLFTHWGVPIEWRLVRPPGRGGPTSVRRPLLRPGRHIRRRHASAPRG